MNVLLADDHKLFIEGMSAILSCLRSNIQLSCVYDGKSAFDKLQSGSFDIALVDLRLPALDGFSLLQALQEAGNNTPIVILTASENPHDREQALSLNAKGFISKKSSGHSVLETLDHVLANPADDSADRTPNSTTVEIDSITAASAPPKSTSDWAGLHNITQRQLDVLRLMKLGLSNQAIAERLFISKATVKTHVSCLFSALNAGSRSEAVERAHLLGLD